MRPIQSPNTLTCSRSLAYSNATFTWRRTRLFRRYRCLSADYPSAFATNIFRLQSSNSHQISLQTTEAALDFRFDHFIGQKFAVDKMITAKTAVSHSGSEALDPAQARGPGQGPTSPMPRAGSGCIYTEYIRTAWQYTLLIQATINLHSNSTIL